MFIKYQALNNSVMSFTSGQRSEKDSLNDQSQLFSQDKSQQHIKMPKQIHSGYFNSYHAINNAQVEENSKHFGTSLVNYIETNQNKNSFSVEQSSGGLKSFNLDFNKSKISDFQTMQKQSLNPKKVSGLLQESQNNNERSSQINQNSQKIESNESQIQPDSNQSAEVFDRFQQNPSLAKSQHPLEFNQSGQKYSNILDSPQTQNILEQKMDSTEDEDSFLKLNDQLQTKLQSGQIKQPQRYSEAKKIPTSQQTKNIPLIFGQALKSLTQSLRTFSSFAFFEEDIISSGEVNANKLIFRKQAKLSQQSQEASTPFYSMIEFIMQLPNIAASMAKGVISQSQLIGLSKLFQTQSPFKLIIPHSEQFIEFIVLGKLGTNILLYSLYNYNDQVIKTKYYLQKLIQIRQQSKQCIQHDHTFIDINKIETIVYDCQFKQQNSFYKTVTEAIQKIIQQLRFQLKNQTQLDANQIINRHVLKLFVKQKKQFINQQILIVFYFQDVSILISQHYSNEQDYDSSSQYLLDTIQFIQKQKLFKSNLYGRMLAFLAQKYQILNKISNAIQYYRQAINFYNIHFNVPKNKFVCQQRISFYKEKNQVLNDDIRIYSHAIENLGLIYVGKKDYKEALKVFSVNLQIRRSYSQFYYMNSILDAAYAYKMLKQQSKFIKQFKIVVTIYKEHQHQFDFTSTSKNILRKIFDFDQLKTESLLQRTISENYIYEELIFDKDFENDNENFQTYKKKQFYFKQCQFIQNGMKQQKQNLVVDKILIYQNLYTSIRNQIEEAKKKEKSYEEKINLIDMVLKNIALFYFQINDLDSAVKSIEQNIELMQSNIKIYPNLFSKLLNSKLIKLFLLCRQDKIKLGRTYGIQLLNEQNIIQESRLQNQNIDASLNQYNLLKKFYYQINIAVSQTFQDCNIRNQYIEKAVQQYSMVKFQTKPHQLVEKFWQIGRMLFLKEYYDEAMPYLEQTVQNCSNYLKKVNFIYKIDNSFTYPAMFVVASIYLSVHHLRKNENKKSSNSLKRAQDVVFQNNKENQKYFNAIKNYYIQKIKQKGFKKYDNSIKFYLVK